MIEFRLDPKNGIPYYLQIIDQIRFGILNGQVKIGEQLPTVRALAVELKVNLNTVSKAYRELETKNILETQQETGTFIGSANIDIPQSERKKKLHDICMEFFCIASSYGFTENDLIDELKCIQGEITCMRKP